MRGLGKGILALKYIFVRKTSLKELGGCDGHLCVALAADVIVGNQKRSCKIINKETKEKETNENLEKCTRSNQVRQKQYASRLLI